MIVRVLIFEISSMSIFSFFIILIPLHTTQSAYLKGENLLSDKRSQTASCGQRHNLDNFFITYSLALIYNHCVNLTILDSHRLTDQFFFLSDCNTLWFVKKCSSSATFSSC